MAAEGNVERHRVSSVAAFQDVGSEGSSRGRVENAVVFEALVGIVVQDGRPGVAVVARTVTASEDVLEVRTSVAGDDGRYQTDLGHLLILIIREFDVDGRGDGVVVHVQNGGGQKFSVDEALTVGGGALDFLH